MLFPLFDRAPAARLVCALSLIALPLLAAAPMALAYSSHHSKSAAASPAKTAKVQAQNTAIASGNVVVAAAAFRGTRYVMGGTSRSGFDCSGFVRYILSATDGVDLPRTATEQYYHGTAVSPAQAEPGDLVFFKNTYKHGISHVGIYIGGGQFIHAANAHKGVRMDSLSASYYQAHFAGIRRVLPAEMRTAAALP
ncbi:MAG: C40 family peptidase [Janthinobacterium lividum]